MSHDDCEVGIEKSVPKITDWHQEACNHQIIMQNFNCRLYKILTAAKEGDSLKKLLIPNLGKTYMCKIHMSFDERKPAFRVCEQQRLCYSHLESIII